MADRTTVAIKNDLVTYYRERAQEENRTLTNYLETILLERMKREQQETKSPQ